MKRRIIILAIVMVLALVFTACQSQTTQPESQPDLQEEAETTAEPTEGKAPVPSYKDIMKPFDELVPGNRIIILQNVLNYSRDGFYTEETKPIAQEITYNDKTVLAYPISYTLEFLTNDLEGTVTVNKVDGTNQELTAEEFSSLFIIVDFTSSSAPVLYDTESGLEIKDFLYAVTEQGEAVYSIVSGSTYNTAELITSVGWDIAETAYRFMATDKFFIPVAPKENATGEIRGTLSGSVNGSFPELKIASGKINDVIYIEVIGE